MSTKVLPLTVSVLLHKDGTAWFAQCLDYDVAVQGRTKEEAKRRFLRTLDAQILDDLLDGYWPLSRLPQAPPRYFADRENLDAFGPELPVYIPVLPKQPDVASRLRMQFLEVRKAA